MKVLWLLALCGWVAASTPAWPGVSSAASDGSARIGSARVGSAEAGLERAEASWILVDAATGRIVESHWDDVGRPIPLGSLVKPFTALAYAQGHSLIYPEFECSGAAARCWLPTGHGRVNIRQALAHSCNTYFRLLSDRLAFDDMAQVTSRFGLPAPLRLAETTTYFGLGAQWLIRPLEIVRAYQELVRRREEPGIREIIQGLALAGREGTASGAGPSEASLRHRHGALLAKTGTSPCAHGSGAATPVVRPSNGDGYVILLYPAERPRYTLLVQAHGVPGRQAARIGGQLLSKLLEGASPLAEP